ncbi:cation channel family protein (macronuclear) [Tetrahymena thermophila SB210]|uniref:Cation channel family protein n=1 Tax=Tetrahymena thermophila (strain SB210) TaxID=312017 RepID=Q23JK1_TETTS|nr:cation channel family protein [Tetrahymena thermophila SB210]EAR96742.2 cation channel family protein [Tetrahymena thermophila SB210]|eukprot:XP_001016987.2 cation channel family protein [Tetrahymena thermophila SB210]
MNNSSALYKNVQANSQRSFENNYLNEEQAKCLQQSKYSQLQQRNNNNKMKSLQDLQNEYLPFQEDAKQKPKFYSQGKEGSQNFEQSQQVSLDSKMINPLSEFKEQSSKKDLGQHDLLQCSHILIQDEIIYEKNLKKLGTKVNTALKSQYLLNKENMVDQKYKQNFQDAFFDKDVIVTQRKLIAKQYFFSSIFITDLVSMLILGSKMFYSYSLATHNLNQNLIIFGLNLLIFLKVNGVSHKKKRFDYIFTLTENQKHISKLINQLAIVITVAHIAAIGWYFLGIQEQNYQQINWLDKLGISSDSYYQKYIYSLYWSITTMTTVGYGDISAQNPVEALYITIAMILFSCVFAYSINNIGFILQEIERSSKQLNDDLTTIQRYLKRKDVNIQLKSRVRHYLSFLAQEQKDRDKQQEDKILSVLSNKLRDEITQEINSKILNNYFIFSSNFSKSTLNKLIFIMKEILVNPNEIIISENQSDDSSIYFIQNGIIEIYQQQIQKQNSIAVIKTLTSGQIFGEISFFSGLQRHASARSVNLSTLYKINRDEFITLLKQNPEDFERFKMMHNQEIVQILKQNILQEDDENYLMFTRDENIITELTQSQYENDDDSSYDDESNQDSQTKIPTKFEEKINEMTIISAKKAQHSEKIEKQVKSMNHTNSIATNNEDSEQFTILENQNQSFISNLVYENQELAKNISNTINSQARIKSFEATDTIDSNNIQELSNFNQQKHGHYSEPNKIFQKKDNKPEIQQCTTLNQSEEDEKSTKKLDKQKQAQQNINLQLTDYLKSQMKQDINYSNINNQIQKQFTNQSGDDHSQGQQQESQVQKTAKIENLQKKSKHKRLPSKVKMEQNKNNQQTNYSQKEVRCSVEQTILQNLIQMNIIPDKTHSQLQLKSLEVNKSKISNTNLSNRSIAENGEKKSSQLLSNNSASKFNQKESSQNKILQQQQQTNQTIKNSYENLQLMERFSKLFQESQLPLLLQLTTGKSFLQESQYLTQNSMDYFDKMQNFKKFYPKNNFDQVLHNIKISQQEQKKQKKIKQATKERRQNIGLGNKVRISIFQGNNTNFIRIIQQDYDINLYKPTYLSYGTKMQKGITFPLNSISKTND